MKPIPGGTFRTARWLAEDPLAALPALRDRHGDVFGVELPWIRMVVVGRPDLVHGVLVRDARLYGRDWFTMQMSDTLGGGLVTSDGDVWRRNRRLSQPAFHTRAIRSYATAMVELAEQAVDRWPARGPIDLQREMMLLTLRVVARTLFGQRFGPEADVIGAALDTFMNTYLGVLDAGFRVPTWVPTRTNREHARALVQVDEIVFRMIREARKDGPGDEPTLLGMLLAAGDESGGLSDRQVRDEVVTLLMAGHATTAEALVFGLYLLSQHPNAEERLRAELDAVLGDRAPTFDDAPALPYTRAVVNEAIRLYPPAWSMGRETLVDAPIGDYVVPKGTYVWIPQYMLHRDPRFWDRPDDFLPERWLDGELERSLPECAYLPFGGGSRTCIGKRFSELEALLVIATIARRASLRLAPGETLRLTPSIMLRPESGLRMIAEARHQAQAASTRAISSNGSP